jgi:hypothetical protein
MKEIEANIAACSSPIGRILTSLAEADSLAGMTRGC